VLSAGATVTDLGPWFGQLQLRHFGPRPLIEDNSVRSKGSTLTYARIGYRINADTRLSLDVFNLLNRKVSDIDYYYSSRLRGARSRVQRHPHPPGGAPHAEGDAEHAVLRVSQVGQGNPPWLEAQER
jgi:hypothetical protein